MDQALDKQDGSLTVRIRCCLLGCGSGRPAIRFCCHHRGSDQARVSISQPSEPDHGPTMIGF
jgi:hypothetical protein